MLIYVITEGCYSDYHIITATTDVDKAYAIASEMTDAEVEAYDSEDFQVAPRGKHAYHIHTYEGPNILTAVKTRDKYEYDCALENEIHYNSDGTIDYAYIMARDEDHAKKICYDASAKRRAELMNL